MTTSRDSQRTIGWLVALGGAAVTVTSVVLLVQESSGLRVFLLLEGLALLAVGLAVGRGILGRSRKGSRIAFPPGGSRTSEGRSWMLCRSDTQGTGRA